MPRTLGITGAGVEEGVGDLDEAGPRLEFVGVRKRAPSCAQCGVFRHFVIGEIEAEIKKCSLLFCECHKQQETDPGRVTWEKVLGL